MQKSKNILLILSAEEREEAKRFIKRRFKILDPEQLSQLQILSQLTKQIVRRTQIDKGQYARNPSRAGKLLTKLQEAALVDMQAIIKDIDQSVYELHQKAQKKANAENGAMVDSDQKAEDLLVKCDDEEVKHAAEVLKDRIESLRVPELKVFRDSCQEMLSWWESERGQIESLHLDELGNINSASGRLAIRQKRDQLQREIFNPFKTFFREINISYQRSSKDAANKARMRAAQQRNTEKT
ncbi:MAG: hypothetical protein HN521_10590 [Candidatus Latescibacteria bacterium]|nr:hypothetical protein [Candidatus Latescibacterota bacterium]